MIPQKAIKKFKNDAHREIVAGILLAYGFFPQTSEGIAEAKKFVAGLDQWIAPSDLPNYYDGIESDLMTGRETAGIRNIRMILEEFYFGGGAEQSAPEEIPVEIEVVEVEQTEPDEPIVVKIEAPFENPDSPNRPKRIRLPRIKNTIRGRVPQELKKSTAERMADAFDKNLDDLIDTIQNPPPPEEPKVRKPKQVLTRKVRSTNIRVGETPQGNSLAEFLGSKIGASFKMAAQARRADTGLKKDRGFYIKKALGFQFGGDLVNRTKGTFSQNPSDIQDPALSRSQRFTASVAPFMNEQGPELPPSMVKDDGGIGKAFDGLIVKFDNLIKIQSNKKDQAELADDIQQVTSESVEQEIKESNSIKKRAIEIQNKFLRFNRDQATTEKLSKVEASAEEIIDPAGLSTPDTRKDDGIDDESEDDDDDQQQRRGGPMDFLGDAMDLFDMGDGLGRRGADVGRRGARRGIQRKAIQLFGKKGAQRLGQNALVKGGTQIASKLAPKAILGFLRPIFGRVPIVGGLIDFVVSLALGESPGRAAAKAIGATLGAGLGTLIPIPGVGTIAGGILGDLVGGAIYDAVAGGGNRSGGEQQAPEKMASGGVIAGEAGPEAIFSLSSKVGRKTMNQVSSVDNSALSSLPFILGITKKVIDLAGAAAGDIKPFISQEVGPLERLFGIANFNVSSIVGKGIDAVKSAGLKLDLNMPGMGKKDSNAESQEAMNGSPTTTNVTGIPLGESETAQGAQLLAGLMQRGFSKEESAAIVGNLWAESGFRTGAVNPSSGAYGLMQWLGGRKDRLVQFAQEKGQPVTDINLQLDYIAWELRGGNAYESAQFQKAMAYGPTVQDKTRGFAYEVERAGAGELASSMPKRVGAAESAYNAGAGAPPASTPLASPPVSPTGENADGLSMTPGPISSLTPPVAATVPTNLFSPPQPEQQAPLPAASNVLLASAAASGVVLQPIYIQGTNQVAGYRGTQQGFEGKTNTTYYDKSGWITNLDGIKRARLQTN